jgi:hypothetical protein
LIPVVPTLRCSPAWHFELEKGKSRPHAGAAFAKDFVRFSKVG